jgi:endonuclease/exonuclease/phosphatase family metal-dependent hydrolase
MEHVVIAGDLNDTPDSKPLAPLLADGSDLKDISAHPSFDDGGRPGTYGNSTKSNKIDYILLSPALFAKVTAGGIDRRGVWGGRNGTLWPIFPEITEAHEAASDHAAIWADLDI